MIYFMRIFIFSDSSLFNISVTLLSYFLINFALDNYIREG